MSETERIILALYLVPRMGAQRIRMILNAVPTPGDVFKMKRADLQAIPGIGYHTASDITRFKDWKKVDRVLEVTQKSNAKIISLQYPEYPPLLKEIYDSPLLLWVLGSVEILSEDSLAVVGTRTPTRYGKAMTEYFVKGLAEHDTTTVSGLAYGIDTIAHRKTLEYGGKTIAVLGSGIDWIYPRDNTSLARDIVDNGGAVITEFPPGTKPDAGNFPVRNRIVSGLSRGILVVETGLKGGSMITANSALDQNREVFIVPHNNTNRLGEGCNKLIKMGYGKLVQSVNDIYNELSIGNSTSNSTAQKTSSTWRDMELGEQEMQICTLLEDGPLHIDQISEKLGRNGNTILPDLLELEFSGCVSQRAGKIFELT